MSSEAIKLAEELDGYFMDQFTYAERATDWRGNNNIAESIYQQLQHESHPIPNTIVMSAGTGGTSAYDSFKQNDRSITIEESSKIEGIGRPKVELSFQPDVIDNMLQVPDAASIATIHWLETLIGRKAAHQQGQTFGAFYT